MAPFRWKEKFRMSIDHLFSREPREFQRYGVEKTIEALNNGTKSLCLTAPTGAGKTEMMIALSRWAQKHEKTVLLLTNRILLTDQTRRVFRDADVNVGVISSSMKWAENEYAPVQIATIQTILARIRADEDYWVDADLVIPDECFPEGTLVDGKLIETLDVGDTVRSYNHTSGIIEKRPIIHIFRNAAKDNLVSITLSNGTVVSCTRQHPVFMVDCMEYKSACSLKYGDEIYVDSHLPVCSMQEDVHCEKQTPKPRKDLLQRHMPAKAPRGSQADDRIHVCCVREKIQIQPTSDKRSQESLFSEVPRAFKDERGDGSKREAFFGTHETKQSDEAEGMPRESVANPQREGAQAASAGRKWERHDEAGAANSQDAELEAYYSENEGCSRGTAPTFSLQSRCWESCYENCNRDRRMLTRITREAGSGQEKGEIPTIARVVSVEVYEPPSGREPNGMPKECIVYNLEVEGNNNYFANGLLVHNCHQLSTGESAELLLEYKKRGAKVVGTTATPLGVSNVCDELIVAAKTRDLQDQGILCYAKWFAPSELDTRKLVKGKVDLSLSENDARKTWGPLRGDDVIRTRVVGNILEHYKRLHPELIHTLAFAPGVKESLWAARFCNSMGIRSLHVDGESFWFDGKMYDRKQSEQEFQEAMQLWRDGDIKVIFNRFCLREGIDEPQIKCVIIATPVGSYRSFLQMVGRGLRIHDSKEKCIVIDHGGCWWKFGSVNVNVDWESVFDCNDPDILAKNRIAEQRETGEPMGQACPRCGMVHRPFTRMVICQYCGYELHLKKASRPILQADGTLTEVTGNPIKQWKIKNTPEAQQIWTGLYWNAMKKGGEVNFNQLYQNFFYKTAVMAGSIKQPAFWKAYFPPRDIELTPRKRNDWHRKINLIDKEDLY